MGLTGTLPPPERVREFLDSPEPDKRDPGEWKVAFEDTRWLEMTKQVREDFTLDSDEAYEGAAFREIVRERIQEFLNGLGAEIAGTADEHFARWESFNCWPYFGHVSPRDIQFGYYERLESQQGELNTWYAGGVTNFELIEPIVCYAKALATRIDAKVRQSA